MKRLTLLALLLVFCVGFIAGLAWGAPDQANVELFADENHGVCNLLDPPGSSLPFTTLVWFLPGTSGVWAAEFHLVVPSNVFVSAALGLSSPATQLKARMTSLPF